MKIIDLSRSIQESPIDYLQKAKYIGPPSVRAAYRPIDHIIRFPHITEPDWPYSDGRVSSRIEAPLHLGTHIDAPIHLGYGKETIDHYPIEQFYGTAYFLNMTNKQPDKGITARELEDAIGKEIKQGEHIIIRTDVGRIEKPHPYLEVEAAQWMVKKKVGLLVLDTDIPKFGTKEAEETIFKGGVLWVSNVANLDKITKRKVTLIALPLPVVGVEAAPTRCIVIEE
jgi:kynurenine formamidase